MTLTPLLNGNRVRLTALSSTDTDTITHWQQDNEYLRLLDAKPAYPKNEAQIAEWVREGQRGRETFLLGIRLQATDSLIGFVEIGDILWAHRVGWLAIGIGETDQRGRGYGREALTLALEFAFRELNLYRLQLTVFAYNHAAIALYERLGFQIEGTFREFMERDGQRHDMLLYGILRSEWVR